MRKIRLVIAVGATCFVFLTGVATIVLHLTTKETIPSRAVSPAVVASTKVKPKPPAGSPVQLSIPSISLDAVIAHAGLKADGTMDIQKNPDQVAWYEFGPRPGDQGSAVIAGHYGWTGSHGSVFNNLHLLAKGDKVSVVDQNNKTTTFIVNRIEKYDPKANAATIFQSYDGKAHLNLITCDGTWVASAHSYSDRLVVFTDLET
jgi:LPXTG-site transpeptidase (sortase) family protein